MDQLNFALLLLRLTAGLMIFAHGYNTIFGGGKIKGTGSWFASMGMRHGPMQAWLAALTEIGSGVALCIGLLTPLAAGALLGIMTVALIIAHRNNGFFVFKPGQGWEYVAFIGLVCVAIGTLGAGEWSVDDAADIRFNGWAGLVWTLVIGLGGAAALLGAFWRPPTPKKT